jgi:hypothetical protein
MVQLWFVGGFGSFGPMTAFGVNVHMSQRLIILVLLATLAAIPARAVVIAQYLLNNSATSSDTQANSIAGAVSATGLGGLGYATVASHQGLHLTAGNTPGSVSANNNYYSFTVTAMSGFVLNLNGANIQIQDYATYSGASFVIRSSLDNYASNIGSVSITTRNTWNSDTVNISGAGFNNLNSITFHIYPTDGSGGTSRHLYFDNIILNGIVAVPEPTTWALLGFGMVFGGAGATRWWRNRNVKLN